MLEYVNLMGVSLVELIRSIILIIASALILITAIGILRLKDEMDKIIYVRIHMLGVMDIASVLALIGLNQPLLACIYFVLAPFLAHAMANAYYYGEYKKTDEFNYDDEGELIAKEQNLGFEGELIAKEHEVDGFYGDEAKEAKND